MATVQEKSTWNDEEEQGVQVGLCTEVNDRKPFVVDPTGPDWGGLNPRR